jgi:hypothetical protein
MKQTEQNLCDNHHDAVVLPKMKMNLYTVGIAYEDGEAVTDGEKDFLDRWRWCVVGIVAM